MKTFRYVLYLFLFYAISTILVFVLALMFPQSALLDRMINLGDKPDLFVWYGSDDVFYQGTKIGGELLVLGEYFNTEEAAGVEEGEYFLFILNGAESTPPKSIQAQFDLTDEKIEAALNGKKYLVLRKKVGIYFDWFPVKIQTRAVGLIDVSNFGERYRPDCHVKLLRAHITPTLNFSETEKRCLLN